MATRYNLRFFISAIAFIACSGVAFAGFESPPTRPLTEALPGQLVKGAHHRVTGDAKNDGFLDSFHVESDLAAYDVRGQALLTVRINELRAIAELDEVSQTKVFLEAAAKSVEGTLKGAAHAIGNAEETAKGIGAGLGRMWGRAKKGAKKVAKDVSESDEEGEGVTTEKASKFAKKYSGVTAKYRVWAQKMGVDPYTTNPRLMADLGHIAKVDRAGGIAAKFVPIPGKLLGTAAKVNKLVWGKSPQGLADYNAGRLVEAGIKKGLAEKFIDSELTLGYQTRIVDSVVALKGVSGLASLVAAASDAETEPESLFFVQIASEIERLHREVTPMIRLVADGPILLAVAKGNRALTVLPVDYLVWSKRVAGFVSASGKRHKDVGKRELWTTGAVSKRARAEFQVLGWAVHAKQ